MVFLTAGFPPETAKKRLDLNSLRGQTKAEELGDPVIELLSLRLPLYHGRLFRSSRFSELLVIF